MNTLKLMTATLVLAWSAGAWSGEPIDVRRAVTSDALVVVKNVKGEVDVRAWSGDDVRLTGELGEGTRGLEVSDGGSHLDIEVKYPNNSRGVEATRLLLEVPEGISIEVETVSADVTIDGVRGERLRASTVSGEIEVRANPERVELQTVSGDIGLSTTARKIELESVSGDIEGGGLAGNLSVTTVSGEALIQASELDRATFESVSGDLELELDLASSGRVEIGSLSGDVDLMLSSKLSAKVEVESFSGNIRSNQGEVKRARHGPSKRLSFTAGDGSGLIRIESFSGDVRIRGR